jgi:hypothetical protein
MVSGVAIAVLSRAETMAGRRIQAEPKNYDPAHRTGFYRIK